MPLRAQDVQSARAHYFVVLPVGLDLVLRNGLFPVLGRNLVFISLVVPDRDAFAIAGLDLAANLLNGASNALLHELLLGNEL